MRSFVPVSSSSAATAAAPSSSSSSLSTSSSPLFTKPTAIQPLDNVLRYWTTQTTPYRTVSLYWYEKFVSLFFIIQLAGLLMRAIVWPARWRLTLRWTCLFNADSSRYFAYTDVSTGQGIPEDNPYGVLIAGVTWGLLPVGFYYLRYVLLQYSFRMHFSVIKVQQKIDNLYTLLAMIAYTPATLSISCVFALWYKESIGMHRALPSWDVLLIGLLCLPSVVYVCIGIPYYLYRRIRAYTFHPTAIEHELFLRRIEAEYVLNINDLWEHDKVWLLSSFRSTNYQCYTVPLWLLLLGVLAWITAFGYDYPGQTSNAFFVIIGFYTARHLIFPTFRCLSSNIILTVVLVLYCIVTFFGVMKAHAMRSELTVDSSLYSTLYGLHTGTVTLLLIIFVILTMFGRGWPRSNATDDSHESLLYSLVYGRLSHQWSTAWRKKQSTIYPLESAEPTVTKTNEGEQGNATVPNLSTIASFVDGAQAPSIERLEQQLQQNHRQLLEEVAQKQDSKTLTASSSPSPSSSSSSSSTLIISSSVIWQKYVRNIRTVLFPSLSSSPNDTAPTVKYLAEMEKRWQPILQQAFRTLAIERTKPLSMVNLLLLLQNLQRCYTAMNDALVSQHILALTVAEAIDSLSLLYKLARPHSIVHHTALSPYLPFLCERMRTRAVEYALSGPLRSRIILKLLAYRAFIKNRKIPRLYIPKVNDNYFLSPTTLAKKHGLLLSPNDKGFERPRKDTTNVIPSGSRGGNAKKEEEEGTGTLVTSTSTDGEEIDLFTELLGEMDDELRKE